jgi:hypothetical protein
MQYVIHRFPACPFPVRQDSFKLIVLPHLSPVTQEISLSPLSPLTCFINLGGNIYAMPDYKIAFSSKEENKVEIKKSRGEFGHLL